MNFRWKTFLIFIFVNLIQMESYCRWINYVYVQWEELLQTTNEQMNNTIQKRTKRLPTFRIVIYDLFTYILIWLLDLVPLLSFSLLLSMCVGVCVCFWGCDWRGNRISLQIKATFNVEIEYVETYFGKTHAARCIEKQTQLSE